MLHECRIALKPSVRRFIVAFCFGLRAFLLVYFAGQRLVPDTSLYARGAACWSSPVACTVGDTFGTAGLSVLGVASATALGYVIGNRSWKLIAFVGLLPWGWYASEPAADGIGALAAAASGFTLWTVPFVALFHLQAALVVGFVWTFKRWVPVRYLGLAAGIVSCLRQWHVQVRYLLPGALIYALYPVEGNNTIFGRAMSKFKVEPPKGVQLCTRRFRRLGAGGLMPGKRAEPALGPFTGTPHGIEGWGVKPRGGFTNSRPVNDNVPEL